MFLCFIKVTAYFIAHLRSIYLFVLLYCCFLSIRCELAFLVANYFDVRIIFRLRNEWKIHLSFLFTLSIDIMNIFLELILRLGLQFGKTSPKLIVSHYYCIVPLIASRALVKVQDSHVYDLEIWLIYLYAVKRVSVNFHHRCISCFAIEAICEKHYLWATFRRDWR